MVDYPKDMPLSMKLWLDTDGYIPDPDPNAISATSLLESTKSIILPTRAKATELSQNINSLASARIGHAIHDSIEKAWSGDLKPKIMALGYPEHVASRIVLNPSPELLKERSDIIPAYMEKRSSKIVEGRTVSGQFDFVLDGRLEDFKTTGVYTYQKDTSSKKFVWQGSIYRWLNPDIITKDEMGIQYIFTNWTASGLVREKNYPPSKILQQIHELHPIGEVDHFVKTKIREVISLWNAPEEQMPDCTSEELWREPPVYKYYKNPNSKKRSTKNFDNMQDALARQYKDGNVGVVDTVHGKVKKCKYCAAVLICKQKDNYILDGSLEL